jgi:RNA polymerase sigma-70 factor (ECF subfamily)
MTEAELIAAAKAGDERAWCRIYESHYEQLYRYALARLRHREDAEDVASQAFVEALKAIGGFNYTGRPLLAWLYTIAGNLIRQNQRRQNKRPHDDITEAMAVGQLDPQFEQCELLEVVSRLTPDQRDVIILRYFLALTIKETAALMEKSDLAVMSLQARAIIALRKQVQPDELRRGLEVAAA